MQFRKLILGGAVAVAITASFAFKAESKKLSLDQAEFYPISAPWECAVGLLDSPDDDCLVANTGADCTVDDWLPGDGDAHVTGYLYVGDQPCFYVLHHQF